MTNPSSCLTFDYQQTLYFTASTDNFENRGSNMNGVFFLLNVYFFFNSSQRF